MFDRQGIYSRFAMCFPAETPVALARLLDVHHTTVFQWKSGKRQVPWNRLKSLIDEQCLSWDWLLEGKMPKHHHHDKRKIGQRFNRHAINQRFLSLFPGMSQAKLAVELDVKQMSVYRWCHDIAQVPWERLKHVVDTKCVTWEWLIEGR